MKHKSLFWKICGVMLLQVFLFSGNVFAQNIEVRGTVIDDVLNEPMIGVNVVLKGDAGQGTITDIDGNFILNVPSDATLTISYIGYDPQDIPVNGQRNLVIRLKEGAMRLDDIVVIGYGTQKRSDLTGSVAVLDMDDAQKITSGSVSEMLQGQVSGMSVTSNGAPGNMGQIRIRGIGSFSEVGPLYVVDGLIVNDVNHVNPADIESIQVLKDAASSAIYGSRGANGVIIMTTKRGKTGKPRLDLTASYGIQEIAKKIKMRNTTDFLYYNELAYVNAGLDWPANPQAATYLPNSDYQRAIFQTGSVQDYNATYTQGTENLSLMIGAGYFSQDGVLKGPEYERFTFRVNTEARYGILKIGENITVSSADKRVTNTDNSSFTNALMMPPVIPIYDPNEPSGRGGYGYGNNEYPTYSYNPVALLESVDNRRTDNRIIGNAYAELNILKVLTYKANVGIDFWYGRQKIKDNVYTMRMGSADNRYDDILNEIRDERMTLIMEHTFTYKQKFGKHEVEALAGYTLQNDKWHYLRAEGYNQKVDGLWQINLVGVQNNMWGKQEEHRLLSYLGRINYNYDDRYLLQMNIRSDGSSKFGANNRRGAFPSTSLGWRVSNESFFEPLLDVVNNLKLRASYGKIGDMQILSNYGTQAIIDYDGPYEGFYSIFGPTNNEKVNEGALQSSRVNKNLKWEGKITVNVGVDFDLLNSRLYGTLEWYNSESTQLLTDLPRPWTSGTGSEWTNYGKLRNKGVDFSIGWRDRKGDFGYSINANISTVRNKVLELGESFRESGWNQINRTEKGRSIGDFYLIHTDGIFQSMDEVFAHTSTLEDGTVVLIQPNAQPGDVRYVDANGDGKIDLDDRQWSGSPLPKFQGGLNFTADWKGIDFTMFWNFSHGNKIFNVQRRQLLNLDVDNMPADVTPWTWDNPSNVYPRPYASSTDNQRGPVDRFLENGSYLRLKNLQIGYTFPSEWMRKLSVSNCRIYLSGQNLWTITKYKGYDPEVLNTDVFGQGNDNGGYPPVRSYYVGLQLSF